jgi:hypothetical protein
MHLYKKTKKNFKNCSTLRIIGRQGSKDDESPSVWGGPNDLVCCEPDRESQRDVVMSFHPFESQPKSEEQGLRRSHLHKFKKKQHGQSVRGLPKAFAYKKATPEPCQQQGSPYFQKRPGHHYEEPTPELQFGFLKDVVPPLSDIMDKQRNEISLGETSGDESTEATSTTENDSSHGSFLCSSDGSSPRQAAVYQEEVVDFLSEKADISHDQNLKIYLDGGATVNFILLSLISHKMVRNLELVRADEHEPFALSPEELFRFFSAVKTLPKLETVVYINFSEESVAIMADWMYFHPTLKKIHVHFVSGAVDSGFFEALSSITNLEEVELDMRESFSVSEILRSNVRTFRVLSDKFEFDDSHILEFSRELESNKSLVVLDFEPKISISSLRALSHAFRRNRTLQKFFFSFTNFSYDGGYVLLDMMQVLEGNTTLRVIWNRCFEHVHVTKGFQDHVLKSLENNNTLERFRFFNEDFEFYESASRLLEVNSDRKRNQMSYAWMDIVCCSPSWSLSSLHALIDSL